MADTLSIFTALTKHKYIPEVQDNFYTKRLLLARLRSKMEVIQGGDVTRVPVLLSDVTGGGAISDLEEVEFAVQDNVKYVEVSMKQYVKPIVVSEVKLSDNMPPEQVKSLLDVAVGSAELSLFNELGTDIYTSDGTNAKRVDGLKLALSTTSTYLGLSPTSYTSWKAQMPALLTANTLTVKDMQRLYATLLGIGYPPNLIICNSAVYSKIFDLLISNQRFFGNFAESGFTGISFNGVPIVVDEACPGSGFGSTDNYLVMLNTDYFKLYVRSGWDFDIEPFQRPQKQTAITSKLRWLGNVICTQRRVLGGYTVINPTL